MGKKIIILNGSPRKNWNTDILLRKAAEGAESIGAETEHFNLYDMDFMGCRSCLACKLKDGKNVGRCVFSDGLKPVLEKIDQADGLILGSPIYFGDITAQLRAVVERLLFQYLSYDGKGSLYKGNLKTGFIYTQNAPESTYVHTNF